MTIRQWIHDKLDRLDTWRKRYDACEVCKTNEATTRCWEGCGKRICDECESDFYEDATICKECRAQITPEQEAEMHKEHVEDLMRECICQSPETRNPACELSDEDHDVIHNVERY